MLKGLGVIMDLFQHRYYKINKILMTMVGQWPYQTTSVRLGSFIFIVLFSSTQVMPQMMVFLKCYDDWGLIVQCILTTLFDAICVAKLLCCVWNSRKMLKLLNYIRTDWQRWARDREVYFIHLYAEQGRKMTIVYSVILYSSGILFTVQPMTSKIIDMLLKNDSKPGEFPVPIDYYHLDMEKYYFYIATHNLMCVAVAQLIVISCDAMFIVYVQHCCGIFAALGHKLERIGKNEGSVEIGVHNCSLNKGDIGLEHLLSCINRHDHAIKSTELIEAIYSWCFFFIVGCNTLLISLTGFQIVKRSVDFHGITRFILFHMTAVAHLFYESYMGQILMDHSISIRYYLFNVKWYRMSLKAQKLMPLLLMRCNKPCKLTAGKLWIMSVETFVVILKTSLSYFTILRSSGV